MPASRRSKHRVDESRPYKQSSDATAITMASEDSSESKQNTLARRSLSDRARVFDKSYAKPPTKSVDESHLQELLDSSDHRKKSKVIHGRQATYRDKSAKEMGIIVDASNKKGDELKALLDASQHRKRMNVSDGVKPVYRPRGGTKSTINSFSIIPKGHVQVKQIAMGPNIQKLLDASQHKKLLQTSSAHRLAHRMMQGSQHSRAPAFTFNLRQVKNRIKPALPSGTVPLPPTETTFQNVHAPKLTVDISTFEAPSYPKTERQQKLIREAMSTNFVLKHQTAPVVETLVNAMDTLELRKGQILQKQGEIRPEDDQLYIVEEGHVNVKVDGKVVDTIKAGQTFGQERLLLRKTNDATLEAGSTVTKLFCLDQMTFRAVLQKQYQAVLDELKSKVKRSDASTTWRDDIYNRKIEDDSIYEELTEDDGDFDDEDSYDEITTDDDRDDDDHDEDTASFQAKDPVHDRIVRETAPIVAPPVTTGGKFATREVREEKKKRKEKRSDLFDFENSPVFQKQEALRKSACKYASSKDDLEFIRVLGEGQFGEVWLVAANFPDQDPCRQEFALKMQKLSGDDDDEQEAKDAIRNEVKVLKSLRHPLIVNLVQTYESEDSMDMLLGLIPGGELWDQIHRQEPDGKWVSGIPEGKARFYAYVLADTLGFLHSRGCIFRDLKPENVMIDQDGYPIIVDFGFAKYLEPDEKTFTFCGTPNYVAPEIITNAGHGKEVDYWALGIVIYEMVSGENPFFYDGMEQFALYEAITDEDPYEMSANVTASDQVRELTDLLFLKDPQERLGSQGVQEILEHAWFHGMPPLSEIHAKRVDPKLASELIFEDDLSVADFNDDDDDSFAEVKTDALNDGEPQEAPDLQRSKPMHSMTTNHNDDSFSEVETDTLNDDQPQEATQPIKGDFSKNKLGRSNSYQDSRPLVDSPGKFPRRKSADDALLFDEDELDVGDDDKEQDTDTPMESPTKVYNPESPKTIKYWTPRKKGLGYFVNMKSPEERLSSQSRRSAVNNFLSQYLEDIDLNDEDDYLKKAINQGKASKRKI